MSTLNTWSDGNTIANISKKSVRWSKIYGNSCKNHINAYIQAHSTPNHSHRRKKVQIVRDESRGFYQLMWTPIIRDKHMIFYYGFGLQSSKQQFLHPIFWANIANECNLIHNCCVHRRKLKVKPLGANAYRMVWLKEDDAVDVYCRPNAWHLHNVLNWNWYKLILSYMPRWEKAKPKWKMPISFPFRFVSMPDIT